MNLISFYFGKSHPLSVRELADLLSDVDGRLLDPIIRRPYFAGYNELAKCFIESGEVIYAKHKSGVLAGCAVIYADPKRYSHAYETYIGIREAFERQGIGRKLTELEFEICRGIGMQRIMTNCHVQNSSKRKLNLASGYSVVTNQQEIAAYVALNPKWVGKVFYIKEL